MQRIQKIKMLRDLMQGRLLVTDLKPKDLVHQVEIDGPGRYYLGTREISTASYHEHLRKEPGFYTASMKINVQISKD